MLCFKDFVKLNEDVELKDIKIDIKNADENYISKLIDNFSFVVFKRITKNLRPKSLSGYLKKIENTKTRTILNIKMNNNDIIIGTFTSKGNIKITINNELLYDVDKKDLNDDIFVSKLSNEYIKYLKNKKYEIKKN
jgi:hypothetical protein